MVVDKPVRLIEAVTAYLDVLIAIVKHEAKMY